MLWFSSQKKKRSNKPKNVDEWTNQKTIIVVVFFFGQTLPFFLTVSVASIRFCPNLQFTVAVVVVVVVVRTIFDKSSTFSNFWCMRASWHVCKCDFRAFVSLSLSPFFPVSQLSLSMQQKYKCTKCVKLRKILLLPTAYTFVYDFSLFRVHVLVFKCWRWCVYVWANGHEHEHEMTFGCVKNCIIPCCGGARQAMVRKHHTESERARRRQQLAGK